MSRKRSIRGKSGILPNVISIKNESGCKAGDKCLFPHHKVDEQPHKKAKERLLFPTKKRKRRQECCGNCENCTTIGLRLARLGCVGVSKRQTVPGKPVAKKSWDRFEEYDSLCLRYVQRVCRKRKDHRLENLQVKNPHQRSHHAMKFEDWSHEETERQQRCPRSKAWNLAKNIYKLKEKDKAAFYFPAEDRVLRAASTKEPRGKIVCSGFRSEYACGQ